MTCLSFLLFDSLFWLTGLGGMILGAVIIIYLYHRLNKPYYAQKCRCKKGEPEIVHINSKLGVVFARCKNCGTSLVPDWKIA